ncbi:hypothetical protein niasHS_007575 [Heterodera schachtii]|uniref:VWFA domain-containing protein n=1 Tax=Heterodera schachtii TaxID=97005 RepID=A0ABD2JP28_HETSC
MATANASFSSLSSVERADDVFEVPAEEEKNEQKEREGEKEKEKETEKATEGTTRNWSSSDGPSADPPLASDESAPFSAMANGTELLIRPTPTEISSAEAANSTAKAEEEAKEGEKSGKRMKLGRRKEWRKNEAKRKAFGVVTNQKQTVHCPSLDVLFIVDSSGSVQRVYEEQKRWLEEILCQIQLEEPEKGPQVALIQFAGAELQKTEWGWNRFRNSEQMMDAFHQVRHLTGTTFIGRALQQAAILLERRRRPVPALVVLLSDGFSQDEAFESAQNLRSMANIQFFALSISELSNTEYLHRLTANPSHVFIGTTGADLLRAQILRRIRCGA